MVTQTLLCVVLLVLIISTQLTSAQTVVENIASPASVSLNRERGLNMLDEIKEAIKLRYYDKTFRGLNLNDRFKEAAAKIKKMETNAQIFRVIAQVVLELDDSHTRFFPPGRANRVEYGFSLQMIGKDCFVVDVKKGSDAEKKGLKVGDQVVGIGSVNPSRENLWKINYLIYALDPQTSLKVYLLNPDRTEREIAIQASFKSIKERQKEAEQRRNHKRENPYKCQKISSDLIACKLLTFSVDKKYIDRMMDEVGQHKKLILDLRGNGGGYVKTEEYLTGYFFEKDTKIADFVMRDKTKERFAKSHGDKTYKGELVVLIDSESASASEVFSRVIQLEKRGKIIGDISAGAVMTSIGMGMANVRGVPGFETYSVFGLSLTIGDLIMSDGKRLEKVGVIPEIAVGPSSKALAERTDPVLAYSAQLLGANLGAEEAGKFYFLTKKAEDEDDEDEGDEGN